MPPPYTPECQARLDSYFADAEIFFSEFDSTCPINEEYITYDFGVTNAGVPGSNEFALFVDNQRKTRKISKLNNRVAKLRRENRSLKRRVSSNACK
jgi:hypothetical protein